MHRGTVTGALAAIGLALVLTIGLAGQAGAQYPEGTGNVVLTAGDTTPTVGDTVPISLTIEDEDGVALANVECVFRIAGQPADSASVETGPVTTDANGNASTTLHTGGAAGTIVVEAVCGDLTAQVSVVAGAGGAAAPPASLPDTGTGAGTQGVDWAFWALIAAGAALSLSGFALARRRIRA